MRREYDHIIDPTTASSPKPAAAVPALPPAAVACSNFRKASAAETKANPSGTDLAAIKAFGNALISF